MAVKLTVKQEKFVNKYLECGNASEAYRYAYKYGKMTDKTITEAASRLLADHKVTARLSEIQSELSAKRTITKERILDELEAILDANIADYVSLVSETVEIPKGGQTETVEIRRLEFRPFEELTARQLKAIESIKEGKNGIELKLHGKSWTIERICKMLGYDAPIKTAQTDTEGNDLDRPLSDEKKAEIRKELEMLCK